jgi:hypothetical protein
MKKPASCNHEVNMSESKMNSVDSRPWYREPWPWILAAGPFIVVIAAFYTAWLAVKSNDGLVTEDYYRKGLSANQTIARSEQATKMGLVAGVRITGDTLSVRLAGKGQGFRDAADFGADHFPSNPRRPGSGTCTGAEWRTLFRGGPPAGSGPLAGTARRRAQDLAPDGKRDSSRQRRNADRRRGDDGKSPRPRRHPQLNRSTTRRQHHGSLETVDWQ